MNKDEFYEIIKSKEEAIKNKQIPVKNVTHNIHKSHLFLNLLMKFNLKNKYQLKK